MFSEDTQAWVDRAALALGMLGFVPYIYWTVRGTIQPQKATWIIWAALDTVAALGMHKKETLNGLVVGSAIGCVLTMLTTLRYGKPGWTRLDIACMTGALIGMLWVLFGAPLVGLLMSLGIMHIGAIPTVRGAWTAPHEEHLITWCIFSLACILGMLAIPAWTWADAAQPIVFASIEIPITIIVFVRQRMIPETKAT